MATIACGVRRLSEKDCRERKAIKVFVIPFRTDDFETYKPVEDNLLLMCYSIISRSKTVSGKIIERDLIDKLISDSLNINLSENWRGLIKSDLIKIGELIRVDYVVFGTTKEKIAYKSTEFFTDCYFLDVKTGKKEQLYKNKFIGKIIVE